MIPTFIAFHAKSSTQSGNYRLHIRRKHPDVNLVLKTLIVNPLVVEIDAGNPNNTRCTICERDFGSRGNYRQHMNKQHKNGQRRPASIGGFASKSRIDANVSPIWDDPNHHC